MAGAEAGTFQSADTGPEHQRRRVFILTSGRSGSTLLASILADAGANFGMHAPEDWDIARGGGMEHPAIRRAANHFRLAFERSPNKPVTAPSRWVWSYHVSTGKRHLRKALREAACLKAVNIDLAVPHAIKMGYFPQIIISCRPFGESALSFSQMLTSRTLDTLAEDYNRFHRNAALQLHAYGGCVVEYRDLTDHARTQWAHDLEAVTGLSADAMLASRARRAKPAQSPKVDLPALFESTEHSFALMQALAGRALPPSPQALRSWAQRLEGTHATEGQMAAARTRWRWLARPWIEVSALAMAFFDRRVSWYARAVVLACLVAYALAPLDPIPNRLPVIGHLDDVILTAFAIWLFSRLVPASIKRELRSAAAAWLGTVL